MSTGTAPSTPAEHENRLPNAPTRRQPPLLAGVAAGAAALLLLSLVIPDRTQGSGMTGDSMTHYMQLLGVNQPWNLLMFMALPVILAETLAITELVLLFAANPPRWVRHASRWAGLVAGPVMLAITVHLLIHAVGPLTTSGGWRGPADVIAVLAYLAGVVPLVGITLVELGVLGRDARHALQLHVTCVAIFLVVAHIAMIFGMLDPGVLGWQPPTSAPAMDMPMHTGH